VAEQHKAVSHRQNVRVTEQADCPIGPDLDRIPSRGKTHVALAVASSGAELVGGLIGWVNADAADSAIAGLAQIAEALGVDDPKGGTRKSASRLRGHLATWDGESLLVFDNASRPEELNEFLRPAGRAKVVVTTTRADFVDADLTIDVGAFQRGESVRYLCQRTGLDDPTGAYIVAAAVGDLPLPLASATATIRRRLNPSYSGCAEQLSRYPLDEILPLAGGDYSRSTAAALMISMDDVERADNDGRALQLLQVMSQLCVSGILHQLLRTLYCDDPVKVIIIGPVSSARTRSTRLTTSRSTLFGRGARTWPTHCAAPDAPTFRGGSSGSLAEFGTPSKDHHLSNPWAQPVDFAKRSEGQDADPLPWDMTADNT
jgi:hypothetical protein